MKRKFTFLLILVSIAFGSSFEKVLVDNDVFPEARYMNLSADPCDDFYEYSCGNFKRYHPRGDQKMDVSDNFALLQEYLSKLISVILDTPVSEDEPKAVQKAKMAFQACMDLSYYSPYLGLDKPELRIIKELGGMPLLNFTDDDVTFTWNDFGHVVAKYGILMLFKMSIVNPFGTDYAILFQNDNGAELPEFVRENKERSYDEMLEDSFREYAYQHFELRSAKPSPFNLFLELTAKRLRDTLNPFLPDELLLRNLEEVKDFTAALYKGGDQDGVPSNDLPSAKLTLADLNNWTRKYFGDTLNLDWIEYINNYFKMASVKIHEKTEVIQNIGKQIYGILNLVKKTHPRVLKNFALLRLFVFLAPDSDSYMRGIFNDFWKTKEYPVYPRWNYCSRKLQDITGSASLSFAVANVYQKYYFDINKIPKAVNMVKDIESAFNYTLTNSDWMDSKSKEAAFKKLQNLITLLAFPNFLTNEKLLDKFYENMRICGWDNYGNSQQIRAFQIAYDFSRIDKSKNRTFWARSPFEVNAYYNRQHNQMNYARIGSVIGHEMTHGYDSEGRQYNEDGVYLPWWSDDTIEAFNSKTKCFVDQYSKYPITQLNGTLVDGVETLNENLADNGGIRTAYRALQKSLKRGERLSGTRDFSIEQLFFIGFGTMWCTDASPAYISSVKKYPPAKYRVNGALSNMEEFSKAFNCPIGSNMNPKKKCVLW